MNANVSAPWRQESRSTGHRQYRQRGEFGSYRRLKRYDGDGRTVDLHGSRSSGTKRTVQRASIAFRRTQPRQSGRVPVRPGYVPCTSALLSGWPPCRSIRACSATPIAAPPNQRKLPKPTFLAHSPALRQRCLRTTTSCAGVAQRRSRMPRRTCAP
jgi:hypothetical protein